MLGAAVQAGPYDRGWGSVIEYQVLNQHLIDAARLEGIRLGLEAAANVTDPDWPDPNSPIRNLDPATIAREATLDTLTAEAQAQGMGYDQHEPPETPQVDEKSRRREALRELTRLTEEFGGYEELNRGGDQ